MLVQAVIYLAASETRRTKLFLSIFNFLSASLIFAVTTCWFIVPTMLQSKTYVFSGTEMSPINMLKYLLPLISLSSAAINIFLPQKRSSNTFIPSSAHSLTCARQLDSDGIGCPRLVNGGVITGCSLSGLRARKLLGKNISLANAFFGITGFSELANSLGK